MLTVDTFGAVSGIGVPAVTVQLEVDAELVDEQHIHEAK